MKINIPRKLRNFLLSIITLALILFFGGYYYLTGTPEYSLSQIKKAIETNDVNLGFKYLNFDMLFENFWTDMKIKFIEKKGYAEGSESTGMLNEFALAENRKPAIKEQLKQSIAAGWFSDANKKTNIYNTFNKDLKIIRKNGKTYIELPNKTEFVFTKQPWPRHWMITKMDIRD